MYVCTHTAVTFRGGTPWVGSASEQILEAGGQFLLELSTALGLIVLLDSVSEHGDRFP